MRAMNRKIGVGVVWNLASLLVTRGASTVFLLLLARLLAPEAFGLIAMTTVVFELASIFINSGLSAALIRSKYVSDSDLNTVFYTNLGLSLVAYAIIFTCAPYISDFYDQPKLTGLVQVMGLVIFINAAKIIQTTILSRKMDFKTQMKANTIATVVSGTSAVISAYFGMGVWSFVAQTLCQAAVSALILWSASNWRPSLQFSTTSFLRHYTFGRNLLAESLLQVLYSNSYILVIGRFFSVETTGLYFFASKFSNLISKQLTVAVQRTTFPALATLQDEDFVLKYKYRQILQVMMFLIAPIMLLMLALAPTLVRLAFDDRWQDAVPYIQLLCIVGLLFPLHSLNINLLNVKGRSDLVLKVGIFKKTMNLIFLFLAVPHGVLAIVVSQVLGSFLALIPNTYFSAKLVDYRLSEQVRDVIKPMASALSGTALAWWIVDSIKISLFSTLLLTGVLTCAFYILISFAIRAEGAFMLWARVRQQFPRM